MNPEETMVETGMDNAPADDALEEGIVEEEGEPEESLEAAIGEEVSSADEESQEDQPQGTSEPGWIRKRIDKAVSKAVRETEERMTAQFEQRMAPLMEKMLDDEARAMVQSGAVKDIELAKELLRYRQGRDPGSVPVADGSDKGSVPQRNAKGQFTSNEDAATSARIEMLKHQADRIKAAGGPDVIAEFQNNAEIKQKVISGEMDFHDVADEMRSRKPGRRPPSPMRSPNGASGQNPNAIESMTDEQFRRLEKKIAEGARIRLS